MKIKSKLKKKSFGGNMKVSGEKWEILPEAGDGDLIKDPRYDQKPLANSNSQIEQNIQKQGDIKWQIENKQPNTQNTQTLKQAEPEGKIAKTWEIVTHPLEAARQDIKYGRIPDNFSKSPDNFNPIGVATDVINPAFYANAIGNTARNIVTPQTYTDIPKAIVSGITNLAGEQPPQSYNEAGKRTLGRLGDAAVAIPTLGELKPLAGNLLREQIYKGIEPVGYGATEKLRQFPSNWFNNTMYGDENKRAINLGVHLSEDNASNDELLKIGQNRLDAFRVGLKLPQKYDTFGLNADGSYNIKRMSPSKENLASVYTDKMASDINKMGVYSGDNPLVSLTENYKKATSPKIDVGGGKEYSLYDLERYVIKKAPKPWEQQRIVEPSKNSDFTHSIYESDPQGIMGQFRWDVNREPYGDIHFQSNDRWDLNPFEKRGASLLADKSDILHKHYFKPLQNLEALKLVGGEPFDIKNNFIVDPKTYEIKKTFENGGKIKIKPSLKKKEKWSIVE